MATGLAERLQQADTHLAGFLTSEIRVDGRRVGFAIRDFEGAEAVIAHEGFSTGVQVGRYSVDVAAFERVALPALERAADADADAVIIDEIARMELASDAFVAALPGLFALPVPLVATVHVHPHPVTDALLARPDVEVIQVTEANRDALPGILFDRLMRR
ncbi:MAG: DUF2478 domain-containing protein [Dactylosporangium sp.]|nr:DUF2478 domain-containing protein [Dactylosporangium sp.]NNJ60015.1 DUF2478 domain-containing protein [Dactylosporangium sp.]